jgi:hypothetical protein
MQYAVHARNFTRWQRNQIRVVSVYIFDLLYGAGAAKKKKEFSLRVCGSGPSVGLAGSDSVTSKE